jgi:hypothetical protein
MESEYTESNTSDINRTFKYELKTYTHNDRKNLNKRMSEIKAKNCYKKIFKIVHEENLKDPKKNKYTTNDNGVFFNLNTMTDELLSKIEAIILYYEVKKNNNLFSLYGIGEPNSGSIDKNQTNQIDFTETDDNVSSEYKTINRSISEQQHTTLTSGR